MHISAPTQSNLTATRILDWEHPRVQEFYAQCRKSGFQGREFVQFSHHELTKAVRPVYSVDEWKPVSQILALRQGSCSQRMACLEAIARAGGIPTRVRALQIAGSFWSPRFRLTRPFIPKRILLVWPQFFLEGTWADFDDLYGPLQSRGKLKRFVNDGESIFEAVRHSAIDFMGKTCRNGCTDLDLSSFVLADQGYFDTRDEVFERFGSFQATLRGRLFEAVFGGRKSV